MPALADAFRPTFLVTQHGCDTHAYDPLAHLRLTTNAYRAATMLLDQIAHEYCDGRWLATGGGGYDAYRVVPAVVVAGVAGPGAPRCPPQTAPDWRATLGSRSRTLRTGAAARPCTLIRQIWSRPSRTTRRRATHETVDAALDEGLDLLRREQ